MFRLIVIITCLPILTWAQSEIKVLQEDFDEDGTKEELVVHYYLGEVEYAVLTYENGTKTCSLIVARSIETPTLLNTVPLCDDLLLPKYRAITQAVDSAVFKIPASKDIDPTMSWLLDVYSSQKTLTDHPFFSSYARFKPKIIKTYYESPKSHRLLVKGKLVKKINQLHEKCDTTQKSWVILDADPLKNAKQVDQYKLHPEWPQLVDSIGSINIFKTPHSVYLETDTVHQIIFVSDGILNQNIQKLDWESIKQVKAYKSYVFILCHPYPAIENKMFVVDSKKGRVFEIKGDLIKDYEYYFKYIDSFEILEDELFVYLKMSPSSKSIEQKSLPLLPLMKSIETFGK